MTPREPHGLDEPMPEPGSHPDPSDAGVPGDLTGDDLTGDDLTRDDLTRDDLPADDRPGGESCDASSAATPEDDLADEPGGGDAPEEPEEAITAPAVPAAERAGVEEDRPIEDADSSPDEEFRLEIDPAELEEVPATTQLEPVPVVGAAKWAWRVALGLLIVATVVSGLLVARRVSGPVGDVATRLTDLAADGWDAAWETWNGWGTTLQDVAADVPERQIEAQRLLAGSDSILFIVSDDAGEGLSFSLLANADDSSATLALLPPSLFAILPGYGDFSLADAMVFEGAELAALTVSNLLGIRIDAVVEIGPGELAGALDEPVVVDLPIPLVVDQGGGTQVSLAAAGEQARTPDQVETIMVTSGVGTELEWLQRQAAVWQALLEVMGRDPDVAPRLGALAIDADAVTGALAAAAAAEPAVTLLPVTRVAVAGADEGFKLDAAAAAEFVAARMPHVLVREGERPRVEILNGNGRVGTTRAVAESLVRRGFRVVITDNADAFTYDTSIVIAQGREYRAVADEVLAVLGTGELQLELRAPSGVVDVSIIVGQDIPAGEG